MINKNDFTWGFELEGVFSRALINNLEREADEKPWGENLFLEKKNDGSVEITANYIINVAYNRGEHIREITLGIFDDFDKMISYLSRFKNNKNYESNDTCGLHIHMAPKQDFLKGICFDKDFIIDLENYAKTLCLHTEERLVTNFYCKPQYTFNKLLSNYINKTKYVFMGNHPQGTIEFRFFSACDHKVENARRFFDYFFEGLNKIENKQFCKRNSLKPQVELEYEPQVGYIYPTKNNIREVFETKQNIRFDICV